MELKEEDIRYIKKEFEKIANKVDLLALINYCKKIIFGKDSYIISLQQFNFHLLPEYNKERYKTFIIKKKSGGNRVIYAPNNGLKVIQKCLNLIFHVIYKPSVKNATGFVAGCNIAYNAKIHVNKNYVFNIDLKDFFNSIDQARIWGRLQAKPFECSKEKNRLILSNLIASFVCHPIEVERFINEKWKKEIKNVLPQGAPTSPILSNIVCERLDIKLNGLAKRFQLKYTRYVDDITFSSDHNVYHENGEFRNELSKIIEEQGFYFNNKKTRLQKRGYRQEVTGIIVNEKVNTNRRFIKRLKKWFYLWDNYGFDKANEIFTIEYTENKINFNHVPKLQDVLKGKLSYLQMLKGENDSLLIKLKAKYLKLSQESYLHENVKHNLQLPIIHSPKEVVTILKQFSKNNTALKYATHSWDGGKDHEIFSNHSDFIKKVKDEYNVFSYQLKQLNNRLQAKIYTFLLEDNYTEKSWGINHINFGWNSPHLKTFLDENINNQPENFILPNNAQKIIDSFGENYTIKNFKNVIDIFKNSIEIRDENNNLEKIILQLYKDHLNGFKIDFINNLKNKSFYVDVDYLYKSLRLIFESIKTRPEFSKVGFLGHDTPEFFCLEIIHFDSFASGKSIYDENFTLSKGDFETIKKNLLNVCDWSIESTFNEGAFRLNLLSSDSNGRFNTSINNSVGFKHIFKFYK